MEKLTAFRSPTWPLLKGIVTDTERGVPHRVFRGIDRWRSFTLTDGLIPTMITGKTKMRFLARRSTEKRTCIISGRVHLNKGNAGAGRPFPRSRPAHPNVHYPELIIPFLYYTFFVSHALSSTAHFRRTFAPLETDTF